MIAVAMQTIYNHLLNNPSIRSRLTNVPIHLKCGLTVWADLRHPQWAKVAGRGYHEPETESFLVNYLRPGDTVLDAGAHIGMLTVVISKMIGSSGKVYAFEIDNENFSELEATIRRNRLKNVLAEKIALDARSGSVKFIKPAGSWGSFAWGRGHEVSPYDTSVGKLFGFKKAIAYSTSSISIDEYLSGQSVNQLDLIKIDVDGPELAILKGAEKCIKKYRPALIVEVGIFNKDHGISFGEVFRFIKAHGYTVYGAQRLNENLVQINDSAEVPVDPENNDLNLFCHVPGVRDERWRDLWFVARKAGTDLSVDASISA
jgi:FkbM family methyltransferase